MARAFGSYPECRWFNSNCRYHIRPGGQEVKTPPFHGGNTSSSLVRVTTKKASRPTCFFSPLFTWLSFINGRIAQLVRVPASHAGGPRFESVCVHHNNPALRGTPFTEGGFLSVGANCVRPCCHVYVRSDSS